MNGRDKSVRLGGGLLALALAIGGCALAADVGSGEPRPARDAVDGEGVATGDADEDPGAPFAVPEATGPVREAILQTPVGAWPVKYRMAGEDAVAEGDIIIGDGEVRSATQIGRRWPNNTVPYVIDADLPSSGRVTAAIAHWEQKTKLRFVPRTTEADYVHFRSGSGCSSNIGQWGGRQFINLNTSVHPNDILAIGINRAVSPQRTYFFARSGYATAGTNTRLNALSNHFRFLAAPGKATSNLVDVAFATNGHLFAWYDDGTVSEGTHRDFSSFSLPKPYALPAGKTPADVAGFAMDATDQVHTFYKDGTQTVGTPTDLAAVRAARPYTVSAGQTPDKLAHVDFGADGNFVAFYGDVRDGADGGAPWIAGLQVSTGSELELGKNVAPVAEGAPAADLPRVQLPGHCPTGATIHEIGHAVGLYHEQTRHDRDQFVKIVFENVDPSDRFNFEKHSTTVGSDHGPYDFASIMHYGPASFTVNGKAECSVWNASLNESCAKTWTIVPLVDSTRFDGGTFEEQRNGLSEGDVAAIATMYP